MDCTETSDVINVEELEKEWNAVIEKILDRKVVKEDFEVRRLNDKNFNKIIGMGDKNLSSGDYSET